MAYDDHVGWGQVQRFGDGDGDPVGFHCTAIADGSRTIEVGADVMFTIVPRGPGRWEADSVVPRTAPAGEFHYKVD